MTTENDIDALRGQVVTLNEQLRDAARRVSFFKNIAYGKLYHAGTPTGDHNMTFFRFHYRTSDMDRTMTHSEVTVRAVRLDEAWPVALRRVQRAHDRADVEFIAFKGVGLSE